MDSPAQIVAAQMVRRKGSYLFDRSASTASSHPLLSSNNDENSYSLHGPHHSNGGLNSTIDKEYPLWFCTMD